MDATYPFCYTRHMRLPSPVELQAPEPSSSSVTAFIPVFETHHEDSSMVQRKRKQSGRKRKQNVITKKVKKAKKNKTQVSLPAFSQEDEVQETKKLIYQDAMELYNSIVPLYLEEGFQFVCLEIETFEFDPTKITEIGVMVGQRINESKFKFFGYHFIIQEHIELQNGKHPETCSKFRFVGKSDTVPLQEAMNDVLHLLSYAHLLISHSMESQFQLLKLNHQQDIVDYCLDPDFPKADTQTLFKAITRTQECVPISTMLNRLQIPYDPSTLHNAGNDAIYIVAAFLRMMPVIAVNPTSSSA